MTCVTRSGRSRWSAARRRRGLRRPQARVDERGRFPNCIRSYNSVWEPSASGADRFRAVVQTAIYLLPAALESTLTSIRNIPYNIATGIQEYWRENAGTGTLKLLGAANTIGSVYKFGKLTIGVLLPAPGMSSMMPGSRFCRAASGARRATRAARYPSRRVRRRRRGAASEAKTAPPQPVVDAKWPVGGALLPSKASA